MKPIVRRPATSTTATAFSPASATYSLLPSGLTPSPSGIEPFGPKGTSPTPIVATRRSVRVSRTETVSLFAFAVYTSSRTGFAAIALGWSAWNGFASGESTISPTFCCAAVSITATERPAHWVTYALVPWRLNATPSGSRAAPRSMVAATTPAAGSITFTLWPGGSSYEPVVKGGAPRLSAT
jgi:hypothetical protein